MSFELISFEVKPRKNVNVKLINGLVKKAEYCLAYYVNRILYTAQRIDRLSHPLKVIMFNLKL